jgi:hypothetical protein
VQREEFAAWEHDATHYAVAALNLLAATLTLGGVALACIALVRLLDPLAGERLRAARRALAVVLAASFAGLVVLTVAIRHLLRGRIDASLHLVNLALLATGLLLLVWLLYAPQLWWLARGRPRPPAARAYDLSLAAVLLAAGAARITLATPMADLLLCWAGLLLAHHGSLLWQGRSVFVELAMELPQWPGVLQRHPGFASDLLALQRAMADEARGRPWLRPAAAALLAGGAAICGASAWRLVAFLRPP